MLRRPFVVAGGTALLGIALLAVAAGCGGAAEGCIDAQTPRTCVNGEPMNYHGTEDVSGKTTIVLKVDSYYFKPTILVGRPGQKLAIKFENIADIRHNFAIEQGDGSGQVIDENVEPESDAVGQTTTVTFPESGHVVFESEFYEDRGMRGKLAVKSPSS